MSKLGVQKIMTATLVGIDAALVEVEADVSNGLPSTIIVGLPDAAVQESRERVRSAIKHSGFNYPQTRVSLNLAPGTLPKVGTHFDLPIAVSIMLAAGLLNPAQLRHSKMDLKYTLIVGELSLDGSIRPAAGVLAMVQAAQSQGFTTAFVPTDSAAMASLVKGIVVYPVENLTQLIDHINGTKSIYLSEATNESLEGSFQKIEKQILEPTIDFAEIIGQDAAKRALEIAAAGGHNLLMTGPPGSGKTMLSKALAGILPPLNMNEVLELTKIYNSVGRLQQGVILQRPFRSPHHTASSMALIGGGGIPRPGEVTLAHHGVLFLDELPEFPRSVLEVLRQPLEDHNITITRSKQAYTFPAEFILVAAKNPCPCGNFDQSILMQSAEDKKLNCDCHPSIVEKYNKKISGPLLDRIDLHINVPRLLGSTILGEWTKTESSEVIRTRVISARKIQASRLGKSRTNNSMSTKQLKQFCALNKTCTDLLKQAADKYQLSGRTIHRIQKVARTIADLAGSPNIHQEHLAESLQYRLR